ncbi:MULTISPECIES: BTAD domain-containing putative transcriptional regulator [Kribbella]|uniref:ATP-binding protein n=1 Tax=Kribbella TaxID=182639 RepID=UPI00130513EB|nr:MULTISPECIES: BTAD domain-containing putative transcriptional regulator [Kribbella]
MGPPRVERAGTLVGFDTRKAVALLAHLALADRPRPRDALADLLWPDTDIEHARGALRRTLSTLRTAIGPECLETTRDHVHLIKNQRLYVDVDRFRDLVTEGDLETAVGLFRGEFLEGFGLRDAPDFEDWARNQADTLRRELTGALARLATGLEADGNYSAALVHVRRWLSLDPLHEPAHRALIRLYALTGDRAAALVQYRQCVRTLSRELGVSPLPETTELYEAVNTGTLIASPPTAETAETPAQDTQTPFVGRNDDIRAVRAVYDTIDHDGRLVVVEGEAGIGKTRLVEELVLDLRKNGAAVLAGRAYEDEAALAYAPLVDALRARLREDARWVDDVPLQTIAEVSRLLPEIADIRPEPQAEGPGAEARFLAAVWDTLAAAVSGPVPGVIHLDNAQWLDEASLVLLRYGLRRRAGRPLLITLTWRTPADHPFGSVVAEGGGVVHRLGRLDLEAIGELLATARPSMEHELSLRLYDETEGVPLLVVEYLNALTTGADESWPVPTGVNDLLGARLARVSDTGRQVLAAAAVLGRSFDVDTVRAVGGRTDEETVASLEELVRRGLIREGALDYDFVHDQLRRLVSDDTSLARRRLLHARAAHAVHAPAAVVAHHLQLAGQDQEAAQAYAAAADQARKVYANAEALDHLHAALALGHDSPSTLHASIGDLETLAGDYAAAVRSYELAAADAATANLPGIEHRLGRLRHRRGEWALAEAHFRAALDTLPPDQPAEHARVTADLSLTRHDAGDTAGATELARQALAFAAESGDRRALGQAHNMLGMLATAGGRIDDAFQHLRTGRDLAEQIGDLPGRVAALNNLALAHRAHGELEPALELATIALALCTEEGDRHREAALHNNLADLHHALGHPDETMRHLKSAVAIFAEVGDPHGTNIDAADEPRPEVWKLVRW